MILVRACSVACLQQEIGFEYEVLGIRNKQDCWMKCNRFSSSCWSGRATEEPAGIMGYQCLERLLLLGIGVLFSSPSRPSHRPTLKTRLRFSAAPCPFRRACTYSCSLPGTWTCIFVSLVGGTVVCLLAGLPALQSPGNQ